MKKQSAFTRKVSDLAYCNKEMNRTAIELRRAWNEVYRLLNKKSPGKK